MTTIDSRILDTDARWREWCEEHNIQNPFKERSNHTKIEHKIVNGVECWEFSPEDQAWEEEWKKRRDEYLWQEQTFRLWDMHFWMDDWEKFQRMGVGGYVDMSIYLPCDLANRQCAMTCAYFLGECPRQEEELKSPVKGLEGRYKDA